MVPQKQKLLTNSMLHPMARHALLHSLKLRKHTVKQQSQKLLRQFPAQICKAAGRVHVQFLIMLIGSCQDTVIPGYHLIFIFSCYSYSLQQNCLYSISLSRYCKILPKNHEYLPFALGHCRNDRGRFTQSTTIILSLVCSESFASEIGKPFRSCHRAPAPPAPCPYLSAANSLCCCKESTIYEDNYMI